MEMQRGMLVLAWGCRLVCLPRFSRWLHQMDMQTLMATQRVCHAWADQIRRSRSLQKALFLSLALLEPRRSSDGNAEGNARASMGL
jgi:hypothetical protein